MVGIAGNQLRGDQPRQVGAAAGQELAWAGLIAGDRLPQRAAWLYARTVGFDPFIAARSLQRRRCADRGLLVLAGFVLQPVAVRIAALATRGRTIDPPDGSTTPRAWVQGAVVVPLMIAAFLVSAILWGECVGAPRTAAGALALSLVNTYGELFTNALALLAVSRCRSSSSRCGCCRSARSSLAGLEGPRRGHRRAGGRCAGASRAAVRDHAAAP